MAVDSERFLQWAIDRFGEENIKFKKGGEEICTHSFFADGDPRYPDGDHKYKLFMNPSGGSAALKGRQEAIEGGSYRCWKTDKMGTLVHLVALVDRIPYEQAAEMICSELPLRALEQKVMKFFQSVQEEPAPIVRAGDLQLPPYCLELTKMSPTSFWYLRAAEYLQKRKLPLDGLYLCCDGEYKNRIVIPYYDQTGRLIYYNARTLSKKDTVLRYMKPKPEEARQDQVLYFREWPLAGAKVYLTEGEFDAITLCLAGFWGVACGGKYLSATQIEMLRKYKVTLAFDSDEAGQKALMDYGETLLENGFTGLSYVRPPAIYKDWNKLYETHDAAMVKGYVQKYEKPYTSQTLVTLKLAI